MLIAVGFRCCFSFGPAQTAGGEQVVISNTEPRCGFFKFYFDLARARTHARTHKPTLSSRARARTHARTHIHTHTPL